jgi:hypothetical protein
MPADFNHHAAKELEPPAIIYRQWPAAVALHVLSASVDVNAPVIAAARPIAKTTMKAISVRMEKRFIGPPIGFTYRRCSEPKSNSL